MYAGSRQYSEDDSSGCDETVAAAKEHDGKPTANLLVIVSKLNISQKTASFFNIESVCARDRISFVLDP